MTNWTAPPRDSTLTYFSSADGGAEHRIPSQLEFEQSLVYNLLFEPNGLVVPDVFFFNSRPLLNHLAGANASLFEEALKNGLVVPCVRDPAAETFTDMLSTLRGIRGVEGQVAEVAERFDVVTRDAMPRSRIVWPRRMGESFRATIKEIFTSPGAEAVDEYTCRLWRETATWREIALNEGERLTAEMGGEGIRRAEMWNALGHELGVLSRGRSFHKPAEFIDAVAPEKQDLLQEPWVVSSSWQ